MCDHSEWKNKKEKEKKGGLGSGSKEITMSGWLHRMRGTWLSITHTRDSNWIAVISLLRIEEIDRVCQIKWKKQRVTSAQARISNKECNHQQELNNNNDCWNWRWMPGRGWAHYLYLCPLPDTRIITSAPLTSPSGGCGYVPASWLPNHRMWVCHFRVSIRLAPAGFRSSVQLIYHVLTRAESMYTGRLEGWRWWKWCTVQMHSAKNGPRVSRPGCKVNPTWDLSITAAPYSFSYQRHRSVDLPLVCILCKYTYVLHTETDREHFWLTSVEPGSPALPIRYQTLSSRNTTSEKQKKK